MGSDSVGAYYLREANENDKELLLNWANDEMARKNAFNTSQILPEEHAKWFRSVMADPNAIIFILMKDKVPVGQCRLTIEDGIADIDYSIDSSMRGTGLGKILLDLVNREVSVNHKNIVKLIGRVKVNNSVSMRCFESEGFSEVYRVYEKEIRR